MRSVVGRGIMGVVLGLFIAASGLQADEKITLDKVPARIKRALKAKYPKAHVVSAAKETEGGKTVYEFKLEDGDKKWEATFTPAGRFVGTEQTIEEGDLPAAVKKALHKKYPEAKVLKMDKETTGEGASAKVVYEIVIEMGSKKSEVQFDPKGKFLGEEGKK
jgi:Putative beta-lactamase-inhibitor-like, PepSY-like